MVVATFEDMHAIFPTFIIARNLVVDKVFSLHFSHHFVCKR
jgi:hypothetical protein